MKNIVEKIIYIMIITSTILSAICSVNLWNISMLAKVNGNMLYYYIMITIFCLVGLITIVLSFISYVASKEFIKIIKGE